MGTAVENSTKPGEPSVQEGLEGPDRDRLKESMFEELDDL